MELLKKLFGGAQRDTGMYFYVRCNACGEAIRVRVNPANDLSPVYEGEEAEDDGFELRKEILGNRCFRLIEGVWRFDARKRLIESEIHGGAEVTAAEYEAQEAART